LPRWSFVAGFGDKTFAYHKLVDSVHDVAWHMQPYLFHGMNLLQGSFKRRVVNKLRRMFSGRW
jgi:hypothetical protein